MSDQASETGSPPQGSLARSSAPRSSSTRQRAHTVSPRRTTPAVRLPRRNTDFSQSLTLDELTPHRPGLRRVASLGGLSLTSLVEGATRDSTSPATPASQAPAHPLIEAFFVVAADNQGVSTSKAWPSKILGSCLEETVVKRGFCPSPAAFGRDFRGKPFIFSLLETTLDPNGNPDGVLYGCVCGEDPSALVDPVSVVPEPRASAGSQSMMSRAIKAFKTGRNSGHMRTFSNPESWRVLCLVSKLPLFNFLFQVLQSVREQLRVDPGHVDELPGHVDELLSRLNEVGLSQQLLDEGVTLPGLGSVSLRLPWAAPNTWISGFQRRPEDVARLQAAWGLEVLFVPAVCPVSFENFARLLAFLLLEQKVLLLGSAPFVSALALTLRALMWPFRWMHPFLSASPAGGLSIPFADSPFPVFAALNSVADLGYSSPEQVPSGVVTYMLEKDSIVMGHEFETIGGLKSANVRLPSGGHKRLVSSAAQSKFNQKQGGLTPAETVEAIRTATESEVRTLADLVESYARDKVTKAFSNNEAVKPQDLIDRALHRGAFVRWLLLKGHSEANAGFYGTFIDTQLCRLHMEEKILEQYSSSSEVL